MGMVECPEFVQSFEKGGSLSIRNSCLKCGRTKAAHVEKVDIPSDQLASEWLIKAGYERAPYFELVRVILTRYIEHTRK
jgi:hypothetical protein